MSAQRIASRYAKSLLDLAIERKELEHVLEDMQYVQGALESRDLFLLIKSPIISGGKKKSIFRRLFQDKLSKTTNAFFDIMIRKGRENILPEIAHSFVEQYREYKKISSVVLRTAVVLDDATIQAIKAKLSASDKVMENIELEVKVDPSLLGGFVLEFEGRQYDSSLSAKLKDLRKQFSN